MRVTTAEGGLRALLTAAPGHRPGAPDPLAAGTAVRLAVRVPLFTVITTGLGVVAHVAAGGQPPSFRGLLVLFAAVALLWRAVAGPRAEASLARLLGGVLWVQVGIHLALSYRAGAAAPGYLHCGDDARVILVPLPGSGASGAPLPGGTGDTVHAMGHGSVWMWASHALAALVVAFWLRRGEGAVWHAVRRVWAAFLPSPRPLPIPARPLSTWVATAGDARLDPPPVLLGHRWRGPPAPGACAVSPFRHLAHAY